jgi:hypothetical protein
LSRFELSWFRAHAIAHIANGGERGAAVSVAVVDLMVRVSILDADLTRASAFCLRIGSRRRVDFIF